jgi:hypothetical protein
MVLKYTNIFHSKAFKNIPKLGFLVSKYTYCLTTLVQQLLGHRQWFRNEWKIGTPAKKEKTCLGAALFPSADCPNFFVQKLFFVANYAYSEMTQDNRRQPDVAFCSILGVTPRQYINVAPTPIEYPTPLFDNPMFVIMYECSLSNSVPTRVKRWTNIRLG